MNNKDKLWMLEQLDKREERHTQEHREIMASLTKIGIAITVAAAVAPFVLHSLGII